MERRDARFVDSSLPTKPAACFNEREWDNLVAPYYPTEYNHGLKLLVKLCLHKFKVDPPFIVPTHWGSTTLNLNSLNGLSEAMLTLFSLGSPLHKGPLFYPVFNQQTRDCIEKKVWFGKYPFKEIYCLLDRIHKEKSYQTGVLYRGVDVPFSYHQGDTFLFHQFTSTSSDMSIALHFLRPNGTLFQIESAQGLAMERYSQYPNEEEYLIHPFEEFYVKEIQSYGNKTMVTLSKPRKSFCPVS